MEATSKAIFAREWVAQGLRPECVEEALEKRAKWDNEASTMAAEFGAEEASRLISDKAQRLGVSMCAEARMREAAQDALDGSRLPGANAVRSSRVDKVVGALPSPPKAASA